MADKAFCGAFHMAHNLYVDVSMVSLFCSDIRLILISKTGGNAEHLVSNSDASGMDGGARRWCPPFTSESQSTLPNRFPAA